MPHMGVKINGLCYWSDVFLGRHAPHADVAVLIEQAHPKYLRPWQRGDRFSMGRFFRILRDGQKSVIIVMVTIRKYRHRLELCYG